MSDLLIVDFHPPVQSPTRLSPARMILSSWREVHSVRNNFTGFSTAALPALMPKIISEITIMITPLTKNIHQLKLVRYAKFCSHPCICHHAIGVAIINASMSNLTKSVESKAIICRTEAPNTFRIPISFIRLLVMKITSPNNPRELINSATAADQVNSFESC